MADKREFSALTQAVREAKLAAKIADLPKGLRKMAAILSEARGQVRSEMARGYLTGLTDLVEALEEIPPRLWRQGIAEIESIMRFASADDLLGDEDKQALQQTTNSLKSEISRQSGLAVRTGNVLARGVKRLGEGALERGAGYYGRGGIFVRMASKLALSAVERRRETREAGKQFARVRSTALGTAASERSYSSRFADIEDTSPRRTGGDVEVEQLGELKKINKTLVQQIKVAQDIDAGEDREDVLRESRAAYVSGEAALERDSMRLTFGEREEQKETPKSFFEKLMSMLGPLGSIIGGVTSALGNIVGGLGRFAGSLLGAIANLGRFAASLLTSPVGAALMGLAGAAWLATKTWNWFHENFPDMLAGTLASATASVEKIAGTGAKIIQKGIGWGGNLLAKGADIINDPAKAARGLAGLGRKIAGRGVSAAASGARWVGRARAVPIAGAAFGAVGALGDWYSIKEQEKLIEQAEAAGNFKEAELRRKSVEASKVALWATGTELAATGAALLTAPTGVGGAVSTGAQVAAGLTGAAASGTSAYYAYQADKINKAYREKTGFTEPPANIGTANDPMRGQRYNLYQQFPMLRELGMGMGDTVVPYAGALGVGQGGVDDILNTIKSKESGGNYTIKNSSSSASGAYQFTDSTWRGLTRQYGVGGEFARAADAPPAIQDAVARRYVEDILRESGGDVSKVPLKWYTGNIEGKISSSALAANRGLTPQQYQADWLSRYAGVGGGASFAGSIPSFSRNANPVASQSSAAAGRGANVNVISAPNVAPVVVNQNGGGTTFVPMPIRTEPIENTLLAITRLNYV